MPLKPGKYQLRSGFGSYIGVIGACGAAAYGAGSCFEAVLHAVSSSTEVMAIRRVLVESVFICRYLFSLVLEVHATERKAAMSMSMPTTGIIYVDPSFRTRRTQYRISLQSRCPAFRIVFSALFVCTVTHIVGALDGGFVHARSEGQAGSCRRGRLVALAPFNRLGHRESDNPRRVPCADSAVHRCLRGASGECDR